MVSRSLEQVRKVYLGNLLCFRWSRLQLGSLLVPTGARLPPSTILGTAPVCRRTGIVQRRERDPPFHAGSSLAGWPRHSRREGTCGGERRPPGQVRVAHRAPRCPRPAARLRANPQPQTLPGRNRRRMSEGTLLNSSCPPHESGVDRNPPADNRVVDNPPVPLDDRLP